MYPIGRQTCPRSKQSTNQLIETETGETHFDKDLESFPVLVFAQDLDFENIDCLVHLV
jgi:hypothetical protein